MELRRWWLHLDCILGCLRHGSIPWTDVYILELCAISNAEQQSNWSTVHKCRTRIIYSATTVPSVIVLEPQWSLSSCSPITTMGHRILSLVE